MAEVSEEDSVVEPSEDNLIWELLSYHFLLIKKDIDV